MQPEGPFEPAADEVDGLRRPGGHDGIHGMLREVLLQETDRRPHPADARIGHETVAPDPQRQPLLPVLLLGIDGIHLPLAAGQPAVDGIGLQDARLDDFRAGRHVREQALVTRQLLRILRGIDHRLPAEIRQVLAELHPALDARTTGRGPIVGDDQQTLHGTQR